MISQPYMLLIQSSFTIGSGWRMPWSTEDAEPPSQIGMLWLKLRGDMNVGCVATTPTTEPLLCVPSPLPIG